MSMSAHTTTCAECGTVHECPGNPRSLTVQDMLMTLESAKVTKFTISALCRGQFAVVVYANGPRIQGQAMWIVNEADAARIYDELISKAP